MSANAECPNRDDQGQRELDRWREFAASHLPPRTASTQRLVLFHARWRLAWCFEELAAPGYSDAIRDGYSAAFKVFLAYTAHEQLAEAVGLKHNGFPLEADPVLAADIRVHLERLRREMMDQSKGAQATGLAAFWDGASDDVRLVAYGLRNVVAHGPFTASKLRTKKSLAVLERLAEALLLADETWFGDWLNTLGQGDGGLHRTKPSRGQ